MKHIKSAKRKIDAYFFAIEEDECVSVSDQAIYYGGMTVMTVIALATGLAVY